MDAGVLGRAHEVARQRLERRERDLERRIAATELATEPRELRDDRRGLRDAEREPVPAVAFPRRASERRRRPAADDDRGMRALHRLRLEADAGEAREAAVVRGLG